jgi:hypothetical protein
MRERFFQNLVHNCGYVMSFSAHGAIDQVRVKRVSFIIGKLAVQIGRQPDIDFVVNRRHTFNPWKREQGEVVCAWMQAPVPEFLAAPR